MSDPCAGAMRKTTKQPLPSGVTQSKGIPVRKLAFMVWCCKRNTKETGWCEGMLGGGWGQAKNQKASLEKVTCELSKP